ncbi:hypothetical protein [Noviherbaspirillum denitrificans]|uniref:Uncharacterized protein n=1 Tax=Noviherbaspirillum denitrificans TaxID=1968433 RepID=A0A254T9R5_9BURK|nr:hypothetical protein [Noviherbaspirillum denitrificans]OWW18425.1 hypothetical protein AYR66_01085 [Noviherbaspirillum denitrificans]OWW19389.1 hypothetical protein AYR66_07570 [Noviherbaspirillum denitrificans]
MTSTPHVQAIGIPWYRSEDYSRLRALFTDGDRLPATFRQWESRAEEVRKRYASKGHTVIKAYIDPQTFPAWCAANGCTLDVDGRTKFANVEAYRALMESKSRR